MSLLISHFPWYLPFPTQPVPILHSRSRLNQSHFRRPVFPRNHRLSLKLMRHGLLQVIVDGIQASGSQRHPVRPVSMTSVVTVSFPIWLNNQLVSSFTTFIPWTLPFSDSTYSYSPFVIAAYLMDSLSLEHVNLTYNVLETHPTFDFFIFLLPSDRNQPVTETLHSFDVDIPFNSLFCNYPFLRYRSCFCSNSTRFPINSYIYAHIQ